MDFTSLLGGCRLVCTECNKSKWIDYLPESLPHLLHQNAGSRVCLAVCTVAGVHLSTLMTKLVFNTHCKFSSFQMHFEAESKTCIMKWKCQNNKLPLELEFE